MMILNCISELPIASPLVYAALRMTETWKESVLESLTNFGQAPDSFIPGCFADSSATGPAITKYRCLFEPQNTPFKQNGIHLWTSKKFEFGIFFFFAFFRPWIRFYQKAMDVPSTSKQSSEFLH